MIGTSRIASRIGGERRGYRPILVGEELRPQRLADEQRVRSAEKIGNDEFADDRDEAQQRTGDEARHGERQGDEPERLPARATEIRGGFEQRLVHLLEARIKRQHHERQIGIDDADEDRGIGCKPCQRLPTNDAECEQKVVQQALALQDIDPRIDADQERGPERQDHRHDQHRLQPAGAARHAVGHRNAEHQQDQRRDGGNCKALEIGRNIERIAEKRPEIVERQRGNKVLHALPAGGWIEHRAVRRLCQFGLRQADAQHDEEGNRARRRSARDTARRSRCGDTSGHSARRGRHRLSSGSGRRHPARTTSQAASPRCSSEAAWRSVLATDALISMPCVEPHLVDRQIAEIADIDDLPVHHVFHIGRLGADGSRPSPGARRRRHCRPPARSSLTRNVKRSRQAVSTVASPPPQSAILPSNRLMSPMNSATQRVCGSFVDLGRRADLNELACMHDADAVGHGHRLFLIVRDDDEGQAEALLQRHQFELRLIAQLLVERRQRLIEQEHLRRFRQCARRALRADADRRTIDAACDGAKSESFTSASISFTRASISLRGPCPPAADRRRHCPPR